MHSISHKRLGMLQVIYRLSNKPEDPMKHSKLIYRLARLSNLDIGSQQIKQQLLTRGKTTMHKDQIMGNIKLVFPEQSIVRQKDYVRAE
jgi:hypothetical protein